MPGPHDALILYATSWCGDCSQARKFLKARGIAWREVDVDEDPEADALILRHNSGARLLPVFRMGRRLHTVCPFDRHRLAAWLLEVGAASEAQLKD